MRTPAAAVAKFSIQAPRARLSDREVKILELLAAGKSSLTIARQLHLSFNTVEAHCGNISTIFKLSGAAFFGDHGLSR